MFLYDGNVGRLGESSVLQDGVSHRGGRGLRQSPGPVGWSLAWLRDDLNVGHGQDTLPAPDLSLVPVLVDPSGQNDGLAWRKIILPFLSFSYVDFTFDEREFHRSLGCEVKLGPGSALVVLLFLGQSGNLERTELVKTQSWCETTETYISVGGQYLHVADWEDSNGRIPLSLVPVIVHLLLHVDDVTFPEGEFPVVLCLEENKSKAPPLTSH